MFITNKLYKLKEPEMLLRKSLQCSFSLDATLAISTTRYITKLEMKNTLLLLTVPMHTVHNVK
jgi:hypothetical protein